MGDLFEGYGESARGLTRAAFDEMVDRAGTARIHYSAVASSLAQMGPEDVSARASRVARAFMDQGVTFDLDGEERPFPLDVVPRIFTAAEWSRVADGVEQRVRALELFLADVYGAARIVTDGVVPHDVVTSSPGFVRAASNLTPPNSVRIHVAGIDVIRDEEGEFRVLEDNLRSPSGVSYVLANRAAMARVLPELFWGQPIQMVTDYPARLISALRREAPASAQDPTVVVLTPGVHNSAFYEHALLARLMGVHLVEGRDLVCHGTDVFLRTTEGEVPVHVIYRRIDDDYLDPLQFRPESLVGCPGVVNAARAGRVTIANALGNGVADDKLVYTYVPDMIRYYLGEDPILRNVETMHLVDDTARKDALAHRDELVFKRVDGSGGKGLVIGPVATGTELDELQLEVEADPRRWIAQRVVALSTSPTWVGDSMAQRHVDLRPFAVNDGENIWVLPGGLTRVALREGGLVVNSSQGGGSKDTWVVGGGVSLPALPPRQPAPPFAGPPMDSGPLAETEHGVQQQQQQQQQQQRRQRGPVSGRRA
ncbi:MAG TPA: circularly permuted type 2 ATP-grasp protein [Acidimicrobiales bacterium]|nr:circularly permuted type 2 ATP-grasp protein [Acidimicrobiales bacterium]